MIGESTVELIYEMTVLIIDVMIAKITAEGLAKL